MGRDESATLAALKSHRRELIDPKITENGDRIVKYSIAARLREYQNHSRPQINRAQRALRGRSFAHLFSPSAFTHARPGPDMGESAGWRTPYRAMDCCSRSPIKASDIVPSIHGSQRLEAKQNPRFRRLLRQQVCRLL